MRFFLVITDFILINNSFSNSFDIIGSEDIGLYESTLLGGLPGFKIISTSAIFHILGILVLCINHIALLHIITKYNTRSQSQHSSILRWQNI
jgi:hypothetical protein